ncbi:MAG: hypothetical protein ACI9UO_000378 [Nitrospinales bacterium]|jgi:hypothetical protein
MFKQAGKSKLSDKIRSRNKTTWGFNYLTREYAKFIISSQYKPCVAQPGKGRIILVLEPSFSKEDFGILLLSNEQTKYGPSHR